MRTKPLKPAIASITIAFVVTFEPAVPSLRDCSDAPTGVFILWVLANEKH